MSDQSKPVTAAELLRRRAGLPSTEATTDPGGVDIDEEIRRLEEELQQADDTDDDSDTQDSSSVDSSLVSDALVKRQVEEAGVISLSSTRDERIEKLPEKCLPVANKKRTLKGIDGDTKAKKRRELVSDGLTAAVKEVLDGYKPRSAERLPLYCRFCAKQYTTEQEFVNHKQTEFHMRAVEMERKVSFCKLCRKQLTSPAQLKEHLSSRPHKERLQTVQAKQQTRTRTKI
jgi:hypothetical protein